MRQAQPYMQQAQQSYQQARPAAVLIKKPAQQLTNTALNIGGQVGQRVNKYFAPAPNVRARDLLREYADIRGVQRNLNRAAAITAPYLVSQKDLPRTVENAVGGVYTKVNPLKEFFSIAGDMPVPVALVGRAVASVGFPLAKKVLPEVAFRLASKSLREFGPAVLNKSLGELFGSKPVAKVAVKLKGRAADITDQAVDSLRSLTSKDFQNPRGEVDIDLFGKVEALIKKSNKSGGLNKTDRTQALQLLNSVRAKSTQSGKLDIGAFMPKRLKKLIAPEGETTPGKVLKAESSIPGNVDLPSRTSNKVVPEIPTGKGTAKLTASETLQPQSVPGEPGSLASPTPPLSSLSSSADGVAPESGAVNRIIQALQKAKPLRGKQEALYSAERSKRVARLAGVQKNAPKGEQGYYAQLGQLKGALPKVEFESIRGKIGQDDVNELFDIVRNSQLMPFEKVTAEGGLMKLIGVEGGQVPTRGELALLNEIFPKGFIQAVLSKRPLMEKLWSGTANVLALPRSIMSSVDLSAPLRQGVFLIGRPKQWAPAFKNMFKYFGSEKAYEESLAAIKLRPTYRQMRQSRLAISDNSPLLLGREEAFMSNLAEKIPLLGRVIKASNRAYSGFLNQLRADVFDDILKKSWELGVDNPKLADDLAKFVNAATGRGDLGALNKASGVLGAALFSPRLLASRLNLLNPIFYYKLEPTVRKEALKSLVTFAGTGMSVLGLAHLAGADVGIDPRSADFGKIKIGNTRYDIWGGFQQPIKLAAQLMTGKIVSTTTGREYSLGEGYKPVTRTDIVQRFLESKASPLVSFSLGLARGQTGIGQEFNVPAEVIDRFLPMITGDMYDLYKERGIEGVPMALPGVLGIGSQTYGANDPKLSVTPKGQIKTKGEPVGGLGEALAKQFFPQSQPDQQAEINKTLEMLKAGSISPESAKGRIKQIVTEGVVQQINTDPEDKPMVTQLYVEQLKKDVKIDIKSVLTDYTLTEAEKKQQVDLILNKFKGDIQRYGTQTR